MKRLRAAGTIATRLAAGILIGLLGDQMALEEIGPIAETQGSSRQAACGSRRPVARQSSRGSGRWSRTNSRAGCGYAYALSVERVHGVAVQVTRQGA